MPAFLTLACTLYLILPVLSVSCSSIQEEKPDITETPIPINHEADSLSTTLFISADNVGNIRSGHTDILIYSMSGIQELLVHREYETPPKETEILVPEGDIECIVITNSPSKLNTATLNRLDAAKQMCFQFKDEDPESPIMTGHCTMVAGTRDTIKIRPFLCAVHLVMASNAMDGYELVESPQVWLTGLNPSVSVLQEDEFRPSEFIANGRHEQFPSDIGFYTMYPGITLYCYPNDTPPRDLGSAHTAIAFEAMIDGCTCQEEYELPAIGRAGSIMVSVTIFGPDDIRFETLN